MFVEGEDSVNEEFLKRDRLKGLEEVILIRQADFQRSREYIDGKNAIKELIERLVRGGGNPEAALELEDMILDVEDKCYSSGYKSSVTDRMAAASLIRLGLMKHGCMEK